jgi:ABC-type sugar transport system ATPase subunit
LASLEARNVTVRYGPVVALSGLSLKVEDGRLMVLLGPSGCGKTSLLRAVAGLVDLSSGRIFIDGRDVTDLPPAKREIGMVFQTGALFPNLSVYENVAYPLEARLMDRAEMRRRVAEVLSLVRLEGLDDRLPHELSGGQRQRVALARALAPHPKLLLLDEPLSSVDARLREELRAEVKRIQRELKVTTLYVTHDHEEAFLIADQMAVMRGGRVVQVGTPGELDSAPGDGFTAWFIGHNLIEGEELGEVGLISFRPEDAFITSAGPFTLKGRLLSLMRGRSRWTALVEVGRGTISVVVQEGQVPLLEGMTGAPVGVKVARYRVHEKW